MFLSPSKYSKVSTSLHVDMLIQPAAFAYLCFCLTTKAKYPDGCVPSKVEECYIPGAKLTHLMTCL